jgi:hypothetical protein
MATITLTTTNQTILDKLDTLTQEAYEGTLEERIKAYLKDKIMGEVNALIAREAREAVTPTLIEDTEIS